MKVKSERDKRNFIIVALCAILVVMGVGYAAFSSLLTINGTANITNSWCVGFDNTKTDTMEITKGLSAGENPNGTMTYSGTACGSTLQPNASLTATFHQPGDQIEYTLTIVNKSSVTAAIKSITINNDENVTSNWTHTDGNITYTVEMPAKTTLESNETTTMKVIMKFQNETPIGSGYTGESHSINVRINTEQDDGNGGFTPTSSEKNVYAVNTDTIYKDSSSLEEIGTTYNSCSATGKNVCLKYTIEDNKVTGVDVCFMKDGSEHCLQSSIDECLENADGECTYTGETTVFNANKSILQTVFTEANACTGNDKYFSCNVLGWNATSYSKGRVTVSDGFWKCYANVVAYCYAG